MSCNSTVRKLGLLLLGTFVFFPFSKIYGEDTISISDKGITLHKQIAEIVPDEPEVADSLARIMLDMFVGRGDSLEALTYYDLGEAAYYSGDYNGAGEFYQQSIHLFDSLGDSRRLINLYNNVGLCHFYSDRYKLALENYMKSADLAKEYGTRVEFAQKLHNIALLHERAGNQESARTYYENALSILEEAGHSFSLASACSDYASFLLDQKEYPQSERLYNKALQLFRSLQDVKEENYVLVNLGSLHTSTGNFNEAESYLNSALTYFEQNEDRRSLLSVYSLLGDLYFKKGEGVRSVPFYNRVEAMSENMGLSYIRHKNLYSLYVALKSTGRYPEALEAIETYNRLKDSLVAESRSYAKSAVDNQLERDLMRNELYLYRSRARERNLLTLSLLLLVLLGVTIPLLYARHQRLIKEREKSQLRLRILHMQMNPHFIFNALNSVQGYVLNDEKGPALNYIGDISDMMRKTLEASSKEFITLKEEIDFVKSFLSCSVSVSPTK